MFLINKAFVSVLCFCLTAQPLIFAAPAQFTDSLAISRKLAIPPDSGNVSGQFSGSPENPHVILVRDAHTNASAQLHISEILDSVMLNRGIATVFVEAGSGHLSLDELNRFGTPEQRKPVAMQFLKKGILQGSEYLQLTSDHSFDLFGVEDESLYDRSLEVFKQSVKFRTSFADKYTQAKALALKLADKILDPRLRDLIRLQERYRKSEIGPMQYIYRIYDWMQLLDGASGGYEAVSGLLEMKGYEEQIDFKSVAQILYQLRDSDSEKYSFADELISCLEADNHQMLIQFLNSAGADAKLRQLGSVPGLKTYAEYLNHLKNIDFNSVWLGKEKLERAYARELISSETERRLYLAVQRLEIFKKLSEQQLTPDEAYYVENAPLRWQQITGFLNTTAAEYDEAPESALLHDPAEDGWIRSFEDFYNLTLKRDEAFLQNIKEYLNRSGQKEAVLIAGGYHTENLKQMLQKMSWSYSVVLPKVDHETDLSRYERLLTGQDAASEGAAVDSRLKNQDTMMLRQVQSNRGPLKFTVLKQEIQKVAGRNGQTESLRTQPAENTVSLPVLAGSRLALSERQPKTMRLTNGRTREEVLVREHDATIHFGNIESERTGSSFKFEIIYDSELQKHFFRLSAFGGSISTESIEFPDAAVIIKAKAGKRLSVKEEAFFRRNIADNRYIAERDIDFTVKKVSGTDFQFSI
ncbi:MAG: hypothetical protein KC649_00095, partial [Candidatus Omnitrophica bacterium]|nr:hypothetical protein [Candidatus Omnitrophota bacterium]